MNNTSLRVIESLHIGSKVYYIPALGVVFFRKAHILYYIADLTVVVDEKKKIAFQ